MLRLVLLVVFIVFPLLEIALLVKLGGVLGFWPSLGLVIAAAIAGTTILQRQGFAVLQRSQEAIAEGHPPIEPVLDGLFLLIAGMLLITPGLITDFFGLLLLVPPVRMAIAKWALRRVLSGATVTGGVATHQSETKRRGSENENRSGAGRSGARRPAAHSEPPIIEGEFERVEEPPETARSPRSKQPPS